MLNIIINQHQFLLMNNYIEVETNVSISDNDLIYYGYSMIQKKLYTNERKCTIILNKDELLKKFNNQDMNLNVKIVMNCLLIIDYNYFYATIELWAKTAFLDFNILPNNKYQKSWRLLNDTNDNDGDGNDGMDYYNYRDFTEEGLKVLNIFGLIKIYPHFKNDAYDYIISNRSYLSIEHFNSFKNHFEYLMFEDKQDYTKKLEDIIKNKLGNKQSFKIFRASEQYKDELRQLIDKIQKS